EYDFIVQGIYCPDGAVNTLYNEIVFSNMIHIDLATRHSPITEKRTAGAIARREMAGAHASMLDSCVHCICILDNLCLAGRTCMAVSRIELATRSLLLRLRL